MSRGAGRRGAGEDWENGEKGRTQKGLHDEKGGRAEGEKGLGDGWEKGDDWDNGEHGQDGRRNGTGNPRKEWARREVGSTEGMTFLGGAV